MRWPSNCDGVIEMETRTLMEPVNKYYFQISFEYGKEAANVNRNIRDWLGENCGCTWETKLNRDEDYSIIVGVYFDLDTPEEDLMAFILRWT